MHYLKTSAKLLFSNLRRHVVTIHSGKGLSSPFLLLYTAVYLFIIGRILAICFSANFRILAYFEVDVQFRAVYDFEPAQLAMITIVYLTLCFGSLFEARLFWLLYLNPDQKVWSHLYDLVVRNRDQTSLQLWRSQRQTEDNQTHWLYRLTNNFRPRLTVSTSPSLQFYPNLDSTARLRCLRVYFVFEVVVTLSAVHNAAVSNIASTLGLSLSPAQLLFNLTFKLSHSLYIYLMWLIFYIVILTLYLVCTVYTAQYRKVNMKLLKTKNSLARLHRTDLDSFQLRKVTTSYRTSHVRLTAFILRYNDSIVSKVIAYYNHYAVPYTAFFTVYAYFQRHEMSLSDIANEFVSLSVYWVILLVITYFAARVNVQIARSGPIVGTILARKGLIVAGQRKHGSKPLVDAVWCKEVLKLSTYYELVWRAENELAFTAGEGNAIMDWKYISEVSVNVLEFPD